jgi:AraC-like DNA-binding protein
MENQPNCMDYFPISGQDPVTMTATRTKKGEGFPGQRIVVLPRPVLSSARRHPLTAGLVPTDAGYFPRAHGHYRKRPHGAGQAIFIYCVHGRGWCDLDGSRHEAGPGDLLVVPWNTPHAYGADESDPWTIYWFHAQGDLVPAFLGELGASLQHPVVHPGGEAQLLPLFEDVLEAVEQGYAPSNLLYAAHALGHLLAMMVRECRDSRHRSGPRQNVARTITYMKQHLKAPLQLDTLAAIAGLGRSQYSALFKRQTGYAPIDFYIRLRMHRACQLLDTTDLGIKSIASELGYEDPLYFSRLFRTVNEMSPMEYRKTHKG